MDRVREKKMCGEQSKKEVEIQTGTENKVKGNRVGDILSIHRERERERHSLRQVDRDRGKGR